MKRTFAWVCAVLAGTLIVGVFTDSMVAIENASNFSTTKSLRSAVSRNQDDEDACSHPELRDELAKRVQVDQAVRSEMIEAVSAQEKTGENSSMMSQLKLIPIIAKLGKIDQQNREWLKQQIDKHGWPGKSKVGTAGAHNAWLLVQHADKDSKFQKRCLELMKSARKGEVAPVDIAYLTDRVLTAEGKPQKYGTQCVIENGKPVAKNVEDRANLDKRRKELGLGTMEQYLKQIEEVYKVQPAAGKDK